MLYFAAMFIILGAAMFLILGLMAGPLNLAEIATAATQSSWTLLASGIVLLMIHLMTGRTNRVS